MRHEPSRSWLPVQPTGDRCCPSCRTVKPAEDFLDSAGLPARCCVSCQRRRAAVARRHRQRALRQVARCAEAGYRALLTQYTPERGGGDAV
jgi:hypothetical protein